MFDLFLLHYWRCIFFFKFRLLIKHSPRFFTVLITNIYSFIRQRGGITEENAERKRWIDRERQKIMDSVNGSYLIFFKTTHGCRKKFARNLKFMWVFNQFFDHKIISNFVLTFIKILVYPMDKWIK